MDKAQLRKREKRVVSGDEVVEDIVKKGSDSEEMKKIEDCGGGGNVKTKEIKKEEEPVDVEESGRLFQVNFKLDLISTSLFIVALITRMYRLNQPKNIVFDELHYGKFFTHYINNTFFYDTHPPLGKQLIALIAYFAGYDGKFKFDRIGSSYPENVPIAALRFLPAFFGSLIVPTAYHLMLQLGASQWISLLSGLLLLFDNALLAQSRFILMESMLLFFQLFGLLCLLKFRRYYRTPYKYKWFLWLVLAAVSLTCCVCVKFSGFYSFCLGLIVVTSDFWGLLGSKVYSDRALWARFLTQAAVLIFVPMMVYMGIFYVHFGMLYKAGPHDSFMSSAFQASLEGGLASITKGQPLYISHGSQITLRHTHGRTCWLHSHQHVYPVRYSDNRGSSHQQQVSCYSFKDVNNWWIVKRPEKNELVVEHPVDVIKHGDVVQLVHGITSRALNSHDVAAAVSPQCQEVSCYIDYNVSMPAQNLWRVDIMNRDQYGDTWNTIQSTIRLIHVDSNQALKFSGKQYPDWGFHQHEVVTDRMVAQDDTVWNVEEHRYTKSDDQKERERDLVSAEMIPLAGTRLSFWDKFYELHYKIFFSYSYDVLSHMYSSSPNEWPFMSRGIAYFVSNTSNAQIFLLGNVLIWYSGTFSLFLYAALLTFYLLRRRRGCNDLDDAQWDKFCLIGKTFFLGYIIHYLPYFFVERTLFLHSYFPALVFKILLSAALIEHVYTILHSVLKLRVVSYWFVMLVLLWLGGVFYVFKKFLVFSYGTTDLLADDILALKWKESWDFILHKK